MNKKQGMIIAGICSGLLIAIVIAAFEVPSVRVLVRIGAVILFLGIIAGLFFALVKPEDSKDDGNMDSAPEEPETPPPSPKRRTNNRGFVSLRGVIFLAIVAFVIVGAFALMEFPTVRGNQVGVQENYSGVDPQPKPPGTYTLFRPAQEMYFYNISQQVLDSALEVKSSDNQQVHIKAKVRYRIDPARAVSIHTTVGQQVADVLLTPEVVRVINTNATAQHAIAIYSGETQNVLRKQIESELQSPTGELRAKGVIVDSFVFAEVKLDPAYTKEIEARQIATIAQTRAVEQQKAALAEAEKAKAEAQADLNRQVVAAQRDKEVGVLNAQQRAEVQVINARASAEQTVLAATAEADRTRIAAEAEAKRNVAISDAQRQAEINRAVGIEAIGKAEAEAKRLQLSAYAVPGADAFVKVEVARSLGSAFQNVRGYLPAGVTYNTVARDFDAATSILVNPTPSAAAIK